MNGVAITSVRTVRVGNEDYDTSGRLSRLKSDIAVEMDRRSDSYNGHAYWEPGGDLGKNVSHRV